MTESHPPRPPSPLQRSFGPRTLPGPRAALPLALPSPAAPGRRGSRSALPHVLLSCPSEREGRLAGRGSDRSSPHHRPSTVRSAVTGQTAAWPTAAEAPGGIHTLAPPRPLRVTHGPERHRRPPRARLSESGYRPSTGAGGRVHLSGTCTAPDRHTAPCGTTRAPDLAPRTLPEPREAARW